MRICVMAHGSCGAACLDGRLSLAREESLEVGRRRAGREPLVLLDIVGTSLKVAQPFGEVSSEQLLDQVLYMYIIYAWYMHGAYMVDAR